MRPSEQRRELQERARAVVAAFDGEIDPTGTLGSWADQLNTAMDALREVIVPAWPCVHCGRPCEGPEAFGSHLTGQTAGLQSCCEADTGQPYGLRAHADGTVTAHCNCALGGDEPPNGFIHTRGPRVGQFITTEEQGQ